MVVMMQKEVADSIVAISGKMTAMAVGVHVFADPRIVTYVSSSCFYPQPKVDSAIVRIEILPEPRIKLDNLEDFLEIVRCGFSAPRKQIHNSLAQGLHMEPVDVTGLLKKAEINPQHRPEKLSIEDWERLYKVIIISRKK